MAWLEVAKGMETGREGCVSPAEESGLYSGGGGEPLTTPQRMCLLVPR